jgi:hypothetical protein
MLNAEDYLKYFNSSENELLLDKELNGIRYKLRLLTPEYMTLNQSRGRYDTGQLANSLESFQYQKNFVFVIEDAGKSFNRVKSTVFNTERYGTILDYANTDLKNDFMIVREKDTLYCDLVHVEAANSLQPKVRLSLVFSSRDKVMDGFTLLFHDNIFNNGPLKFNYSNKVLKDLPELNM